MNEPTQEQLARFWGWCGLVPVWGGYGEKAHYDFEKDEPVELDLNNIFKYAIPKVKYFMLYDWGDKYQCSIYTHTSNDPNDGIEDVCHEYHALEDTPALALFWAIYKVMENTK